MVENVFVSERLNEIHGKVNFFGTVLSVNAQFGKFFGKVFGDVVFKLEKSCSDVFVLSR